MVSLKSLANLPHGLGNNVTRKKNHPPKKSSPTQHTILTPGEDPFLFKHKLTCPESHEERSVLIDKGDSHTVLVIQAQGKSHLFVWGAWSWSMANRLAGEINPPQKITLPPGHTITHIKALNGSGFNKTALIVTQSNQGRFLFFLGGCSAQIEEPYLFQNPIRLRPDSTITHLASGEDYFLMVDQKDGYSGLLARGLNTYGQLGVGNISPCNGIQRVFSLCDETITHLATGENHSVIATRNNISGEYHLWLWGLVWPDGPNPNAPLTPQPAENINRCIKPKPTKVATQMNGQTFLPCGEIVTKLVAGAHFILAATRDAQGHHHLWAWGWNDVGQLGLGDNISRQRPTEVTQKSDGQPLLPPGHTIIHLAAGKHFGVMVIKEAPTGRCRIWAWGSNHSGQLGLGIGKTSVDRPCEVFLPSPMEQAIARQPMGEQLLEHFIVDVALGAEDTAVMILDAQNKPHFYTWGNNLENQLGIGGLVRDNANHLGEYPKHDLVEIHKEIFAPFLTRVRI